MGKGARNRQQRRLPQAMVTGTDVYFEAKPAEMPPFQGQHMWVVAAAFRVVPEPGKSYDLDMENLLTVDGPGCWYCERRWSPLIASIPCPGDADD